MPEGACYWNRKNYVEGQRAPRLGGRLYVSLERIVPCAQSLIIRAVKITYGLGGAYVGVAPILKTIQYEIQHNFLPNYPVFHAVQCTS